MMREAIAEFDVAALLARLGTRPQRITSDSRRVAPGVAFAAYPGAKHDGRSFIADALARGAPAVLWERAGFDWDAAIEAPNWPVECLQHKLGWIADVIYGSPSQALWMVAVTGTNGKTSCTQWIAHAFDATGRRSGVIGTLGAGLVGALLPQPNTTPDAALLQETLAHLKAEDARAVAMEISSIGLEEGRVNGTKLDVALFTNLSRDHLDYHGTMAAYAAAKAGLFQWPTLQCAVVNIDDAFGRSLADGLRGRPVRTLTYGLSGADITATALVGTATGMKLGVATPWGAGKIETPLVGTFNAMNLLGTLGVLLASDVGLADALDAMATLTAPPGRMERQGGGERPLIVIDYAHTPDALEKVLEALRPALGAGGELVCVFGCGGERDAGKRPEMGRIAASLAERLVITSDNPRGEDATAIAMAVVQGVRAAGMRRWTIEIDRAKAIRSAVASARAGDVVLLAGKGHETYQDVMGERRPFSDAAEAATALMRWTAR